MAERIDIDELERRYRLTFDDGTNLAVSLRKYRDEFDAQLKQAFPALLAEIRQLREFERRIRDADKLETAPSAEMGLTEAVAWLDEQKAEVLK